MATKMVLIEYTEKVTSSLRHAGGEDETTIEAGTRRRVDAASAKSLVEVRKVAKLVGDKDEKDAAREAVKTVDVPAETPRSANATGGS